MLARLRAALRPRPRPAPVRVCAWCGAVRTASRAVADDEVTHGICDECLERELAALAAKRAA